ncbi:hypothetical protein [Cylindrospermum stagnale]|uniref:nucleoside phosphorylase n=1 Tax=Cylindrospermum stagnale TaxID=142864 RepID=UPI0002F14CC4
MVAGFYLLLVVWVRLLTRIVVNELVQVGIQQIIRIGTCGSIQSHVPVGSIVISSGALCRQGAAQDIEPVEYPAVADPFLTVALVKAARELKVEHYLGITASVDTFYEEQERKSSANPNLMRSPPAGALWHHRRISTVKYFELRNGMGHAV